MSSFRSFIVAIILSCQMTLVSAVEIFTVASDEIHQVLSHEQVVDHHHHDAFSTHADHHNGENGHQHTSDNFQTSALTSDLNAFSFLARTEALRAPHPKEPSSVYLDGLLRPPRTTV